MARVRIQPSGGARFVGVPLARGTPTLSDHGLGIVTHAPALHNPLDDFYSVHMLWRTSGVDPTHPEYGRPTEVRVVSFRKDGAYASTILMLGQSDTLPAPYTSADVELLERNDPAAYAEAGFQVHHSLRAGSSERRRGR
jgi:hypothetical protein